MSMQPELLGQLALPLMHPIAELVSALLLAMNINCADPRYLCSMVVTPEAHGVDVHLSVCAYHELSPRPVPWVRVYAPELGARVFLTTVNCTGA